MLKSLSNLQLNKKKSDDAEQLVEFPSSSGDDTSLITKLRKGYQLGRPALVKKTGKYRVTYKGLSHSERRSFVLDLFQTLIDLKWRWAILVFVLTFLVVYFIFALIWFILAKAHGDFDNLNNPNWIPCVERAKTFADLILFSIETQTTIGYGTFYPNTSCSGSVLLVFVQITVGFLLETLLVGFLLVKLSRPKHRRHTLMFSEKVCICKENGELCLELRVGDMRKSHLVDTSSFGIFVSEKVSKEGVVYPLYQQQMEFEAHEMQDRVFMMWPVILRHKINEHSPLYELTFDQMLSNTFEIIIILEGTIEATGEICQARTSYSSRDILWGSRFVNMVDFDNDNGQWRANFEKFNVTVPTPTPKCSGKQLAEIYGISGQSDARGAGTDNSGVFRRSQSQILPPMSAEEPPSKASDRRPRSYRHSRAPLSFGGFHSQHLEMGRTLNVYK
ncbi:G protein-activated inward rectifier potassium channel 4-like isoform X1 [Saccostrea cucullata]|uniref:G protein-activated inward rectifier potassium channel 4-like isoform X1 n=2 Tax=Saccostrea cuccullata TaxID=36930 RepID=UPI002ED35D46